MSNKAEIQVTADNFVVCADALRSLKDNRDRLLRMIDSYPVVCAFSQIQRILADSGDVDELISELDLKIRMFRERKRSSTGSAPPLAVVP